jgi:hypothetical protein
LVLIFQELKIQPTLNSQLVPPHLQGAEPAEAPAAPTPEADKQVNIIFVIIIMGIIIV